MAVNNSLVKKQNNTFSAFITSDAVKSKVNEMVGGKDGQRFITSIISAVSVNPVLAECEHSSILSAAMLGESLKLNPSPQLGHYYMVPFNDKKRGTKVAQFQLGTKGYIQLAIRSGQYLDIDVFEIKEGEFKGRNKNTGKHIFEFIEDEFVRESKETIGYMAYFEMLNGFRKTLYWSKEKMELHADTYSQAFNFKKYQDLKAGKIPKDDLWKYSSFWYKNFTEMAFKTMLRQLISKWGIMSIEMQTAFERDESLLNDDGSYEYIDNAPEEPTAPEKEPAKTQTIDTTATEVTEQSAAEEFDFFTEQQAGA